jgi:hypothetical protein
MGFLLTGGGGDGIVMGGGTLFEKNKQKTS